LAYGYIPAPRCLVQGFAKVLPGQVWRYRFASSTPEIFTYWQLPSFTPSQVSESELLDEYESTLTRSVRQSLEADVSVGVLLSGGVDSGLIAALGVRSGFKRLQTFTMSFPGHGVYDEGPLARKVAEHLGTDHHELTAESMTTDLLPEMARIYDEPIADSSLLPTYMICRLLKKHVTVALGGDGGDELFAGYPQYKVLPKLMALHDALPSWIRRLLEPSVSRMPLGTKGRGLLLGVVGTDAGPLSGVNLYFDRWNRGKLFPGNLAREGAGSPEKWREHVAAGQADASINRATRTDFLTTLQDSYLVKTDRASMANSIELRSPFLDRQLIEFAFGRVAEGWKIKNRQLKYLSRRLAERYLPAEVVAGSKKGFAVPLARWLSGEWGHFCKEVLTTASHAPLNQSAVNQLWQLQAKGYPNAQRIFQLTMLELWMREYNILLPNKG
jgi:asparagine synthase (glutamine-hydrolysing)